MNEVILSGLGILLALCGMTVLIFRRVSPIIVGPLAALLVTVMSGLPVLDSVTGTYVQGVGSFFVSYFMIFLLGNILGSLYQISGAAAKIGETVVRWFGAKNCMVACLISAALLSYGGINSFVIIFAIYPIALKLFEEADLPTYLLPGIVCGGMWTLFTADLQHRFDAEPGDPFLRRADPRLGGFGRHGGADCVVHEPPGKEGKGTG